MESHTGDSAELIARVRAGDGEALNAMFGAATAIACGRMVEIYGSTRA